MRSLETAFYRASPRVSPRSTPWFSHAIHLVVLLCSVAIFCRVFFSSGIFAWSVGLAYVIYDSALLVFVTWKTLPLIKKASPSTTAYGQQVPSITDKSTIGVMIAAYNEAEVLERTIESLLMQTDPPEQLWIADDGSNDGTAALLARRYGFIPEKNDLFSNAPLSADARYPSLYWLRLHHGGKALALNQTIAQLSTDIVITVDADTLLANNSIREMRHAFSHERGLVAATGVLTPVCDNTLIGRILQWFQTYEYIRNFISRFAWMRADSLLLISGAFAGFRREAVIAVGGFDPQCLVEDYELIHRLRRYAVEHQLNWQVRVIGSAQARTSAPSSFRGFLQQRRRWFAGFLQTQYWNRDMVGNPHFGNLGTLMLPVKTIDTVQPFYGLIAFLFLIVFVTSGKLSLLTAVFTVIGGKIAMDLVFHLWSIYLYRSWTGDRTQSRFSLAIAAALLEPFTFQLLRHTGAVLGWFYFLTGKRAWGKQQRHQIR